jgi:hypothetical protein
VQRLAEVAHELAAVAQAGQRVGERLRASVGEHREVREERDAEAADDREERGPGQRDGEEVQPREVVGDQQHEAEQREERRDDERAPALERPRPDVLGRQPRGVGEQQRRGRPSRLEDQPACQLPTALPQR